MPRSHQPAAGVRRGSALVLAVALVTVVLSPAAWSRGTAGRSRFAGAVKAHGSTCSNADRLSRWRDTRLAEQVVVVPVQESDVAAADGEIAAGAGGVILFGSRAPSDLRARLERLRSHARGGIAPLVMTDEEGGSVQRMANLVGSVPSARHMGESWTTSHVRRVARHLGASMRAVGVDMDLAPVLDLDGRAGPSTADPIGTRSFSPRRGVATSHGLAFVDGLLAGGVTPVVKHFPGIGGAKGNTDLGPASTPPWRRVRHHDLLPFRSAISAGLPAVMVSNARVPGLTRVPSSLSRAVVHRVLRRQLGFEGLVLPDSLTAGGVTAAGFDLREASVRAIEVGEDMVLFNAPTSSVAATTHAVVSALVAAVRSGSLPRARLLAAAGHVLEVKGVDLCA
ncbi:MAG: glycoside hydrolase family 3 N-terminal domain-containing protein [Nocardioides sp.]